MTLLVVSALVFVLDDQRILNPTLGIAAVVYGVHCRRRARGQVAQLVLRIDRAGIRTGDRTYERQWAGS